MANSCNELHNDNSINCETKECDFNQFYSEYLLCCACEGNIICNRIDFNFQKINHFKLNIEGINSELKIFDNEYFGSIYFMNNNCLNRKNIYPPKCQNLTKEINKEVEINLDELLDRRFESTYFITFIEFNSEKLMVKFNNTDRLFEIG